MMKSSIIAAMLISLAIGTGAAFAEDTAPPAKTTAPKMSTTDKKAISKACSEQATAKGLHGKARKEFRSACKQRGGKPE